uniref:Male-enhanced antigen 1 n=1 Tax=Saimiri boliviensis boliviensis TaxID=39432 RepID=A0A2K6UWX0_SAIBB
MGPEGHLSGAPAWMATDSMGPERIFPNPTEKLGPHQGPSEGTGNWSSEEPEEEQEEMGSGPASYSYQPLNQDPEQEEVELAPVGDGDVDSEDEDEEGATALNNHKHVELVKRTMAGVSLPSPGVPAWAWEISDAQWEDVVQKAFQAWQASTAWK